MELFKAVILAVISSAAVFGFIQFLISRHDKKNDRLKDLVDDIDELKKGTKKAEKDSVRVQLLVLLAMYPDDDKEILEVAQHYFKDLKSNWFMTPIFYRWCQKKAIKPEWFHYEENSST